MIVSLLGGIDEKVEEIHLESKLANEVITKSIIEESGPVFATIEFENDLKYTKVVPKSLEYPEMRVRVEAIGAVEYIV